MPRVKEPCCSGRSLRGGATDAPESGASAPAGLADDPGQLLTREQYHRMRADAFDARTDTLKVSRRGNWWRLTGDGRSVSVFLHRESRRGGGASRTAAGSGSAPGPTPMRTVRCWRCGGSWGWTPELGYVGDRFRALNAPPPGGI
jgi:hypothetical protein